MTRLTRREALKTAVAALALPLVDECGGYETFVIEYPGEVGVFDEFFDRTLPRYEVTTYEPVMGVKHSPVKTLFEVDWL